MGSLGKSHIVLESRSDLSEVKQFLCRTISKSFQFHLVRVRIKEGIKQLTNCHAGHCLFVDATYRQSSILSTSHSTFWQASKRVPLSLDPTNVPHHHLDSFHAPQPPYLGLDTLRNSLSNRNTAVRSRMTAYTHAHLPHPAFSVP
jgi:hypothetical protein